MNPNSEKRNSTICVSIGKEQGCVETAGHTTGVNVLKTLHHCHVILHVCLPDSFAPFIFSRKLRTGCHTSVLTHCTSSPPPHPVLKAIPITPFVINSIPIQVLQLRNRGRTRSSNCSFASHTDSHLGLVSHCVVLLRSLFYNFVVQYQVSGVFILCMSDFPDHRTLFMTGGVCILCMTRCSTRGTHTMVDYTLYISIAPVDTHTMCVWVQYQGAVTHVIHDRVQYQGCSYMGNGRSPHHGITHQLHPPSSRVCYSNRQCHCDIANTYQYNKTILCSVSCIKF